MQPVRVIVHIADSALARRVCDGLLACGFAVSETDLAEVARRLAAVPGCVLLLESNPAALAWLRGAGNAAHARTLLLVGPGEAASLSWYGGAVVPPADLERLPELLSQLAAPAPPPGAALARETRAPQAGRLLIVDDDAAIRQYLAARLESRGFACREAADGEAAMRELRTWAPDVILLDLNMPGMDGLEFLDWARQQSQTAFGVIVLTGQSGERLKEQVTRYGAFALLTKPVDFARLLQLIAMQGEFRKTQRRLRRMQDLYPPAG